MIKFIEDMAIRKYAMAAAMALALMPGGFYWKTQIQFNGNTSTLGSSPRMVDLFAEWQKYEY